MRSLGSRRKDVMRTFAFALMLVRNCQAETRVFDNMVLFGTDGQVHYSEDYVITPGSIDLSKLEMKTSFTLPDTGIWGRTTDPVATVDIAVFHEPNGACHNLGSDYAGACWAAAGVGTIKDHYWGSYVQWCCSEESQADGYCSNGLDRLIINESRFTGQLWHVRVDKDGPLDATLDAIRELNEGSGKYAIVFANCKNFGPSVVVNGPYSWKSRHGYLPGNLVGWMYYGRFLLFVYVGVGAWYAYSKVYHGGSGGSSVTTVPMIQNYVLGMIGLAAVGAFFAVGDVYVWNTDGQRWWLLSYTTILLGVLKRGVARGAMVMLCLGWGVTRVTVGRQFRIVVTLCLLYMCIDGALDVILLYVTRHPHYVLDMENRERRALRTVELMLFLAFLNVAFAAWILDSLNGTIQALGRDATMLLKLTSYRKLRIVLIVSMIMTVVWMVLVFWQRIPGKSRLVLSMRYGWMLWTFPETNFLFVLLSVVWLWRPHPQAKDYALVTIHYDEQFLHENELEMHVTAAIPDENDKNNNDDNNNGASYLAPSGTMGSPSQGIMG